MAILGEDENAVGESLRDQLLKAGLVSQQKAKEARTDKRKTSRVQRHSGVTAPEALKAETQRTLAEKAERDRALNRQRQEDANRQALIAEIAQLIESHRIPREGGELPYHFTDGKVLKKLLVTRSLQQRLACGAAAIVRCRGGYDLVAAEIGERIRQRYPAALVLLNEPQNNGDDADAYAQHPIPDDLVW